MPNITRQHHSGLYLKVGNTVVKWLVGRGKGPSGEIMLLSWKGRRSGKPYSTPVSRFEIDGVLFTTTSSPWLRNFVDGHPAELVLDGKTVGVNGTVIDEPAAVAARQQKIVDLLGDKAKRALAVRWETEPSIDDFQEYVQGEGVVLIEFTRTG